VAYTAEAFVWRTPTTLISAGPEIIAHCTADFASQVFKSKLNILNIFNVLMCASVSYGQISCSYMFSCHCIRQLQ